MSKARWRWNGVFGCALVMGLSVGRVLASSPNDEAVTNETGEEQTELNLELMGDQTHELGESFVNPFGSSGSVSSSYDNTTNKTTVEFSTGSGGTPVEEGQTAEVGFDEEQPEDLGGKYWGPEEAVPSVEDELPAPTISITHEGIGPFVIIYVTVELPDGKTSGEWSESQAPSNQSFQIGIGNFASQDGPLSLSDAKYFFSDTQIPLDQLNFSSEPPTGSQFMPVPGIPDGTVVAPGTTDDSSDLPEPTAMCTLLTGAAMLYRRSRRGSRR
jgi:hypothetical protein